MDFCSHNGYKEAIAFGYVFFWYNDNIGMFPCHSCTGVKGG